MSKLPNGTVLPYGLMSPSTSASSQVHKNAFDNKSLKAGVVVKSYATKDPENLTGLIPDYDVQVIEQYGSGAPTVRTYRHCVCSQGLGSIADFFEYTLRERTYVDDTTKGIAYGHQDGSLVLLMCLDGNENKGIIVGALRNPDRPTQLTDDDMLAGAFNGASINIKKDGSIKAAFIGATDHKGKPTDSSLGSTTFDVEKDGSFQVKHKTITQRLDKNGKFTLTSDDEQSFTSNKAGMDFTAAKSFSVDAKDTISMTAKQAIIKMQDSVTGNCKTLTFQADTEMTLKTATFTVNASSTALIQAPTIVADGICMLGGSGGLPVLTLNTIMLGIGNLSIPVISKAISGFAVKAFAV